MVDKLDKDIYQVRDVAISAVVTELYLQSTIHKPHSGIISNTANKKQKASVEFLACKNCCFVM